MKSEGWMSCVPQIVFTDENDNVSHEKTLHTLNAPVSDNNFLNYRTIRKDSVTESNNRYENCQINLQTPSICIDSPPVNLHIGKTSPLHFSSLMNLSTSNKNNKGIHPLRSGSLQNLNDITNNGGVFMDSNETETHLKDSPTLWKFSSPFNIRKMFTTAKQQRSNSNDNYLSVSKNDKYKERRFSGPAAIFTQSSEKSNQFNYEKAWKNTTKLIAKENLRATNVIKYIKKKNTKKLKNNLAQIKTQDEFKTIKNTLPVHEASFHGNQKAILLLSQFGFDITETDHFQWTILHAAVLGEDIETIKYILKQTDIDVNAVTIDGKTSLHVAIFVNNCEIVELLLQQNANPLLETNMIATPFQLAVDLKRTYIVDLFITQHIFLVKNN